MNDILQMIAKLSPGKKLAVVAMLALVVLTWTLVCLLLLGVIGP